MTGTPPAYWRDPEATKVQAVCLGTGRFLRSVLVPPLTLSSSLGLSTIVIQPRGRSFVDYVAETKGSYEVDTVTESGATQTDQVKISGAFTLQEKAAMYKEFDELDFSSLKILGIGVTEAGLSGSDTPAMKELFDLLRYFHSRNIAQPLSVLNTENVPNNGDTIQKHMVTLSSGDSELTSFLSTTVTFHNSMVDRIVSQRDGNSLIPRCEPIPSKAICIQDESRKLAYLIKDIPTKFGIHGRSSREALQLDISLKLRIANGTHTAIAHALALNSLIMTNDALSPQAEKSLIFMNYLESLVQDQIIAAVKEQDRAEAISTWEDWKRRLQHPKFGLSTFFITQNGPMKGGIRWGPTVVDLVNAGHPLTVSLAFAYAVLLRWLTPATDKQDPFIGRLEGFGRVDVSDSDISPAVEYASGLQYNLEQGWHQFLCDCQLEGGKNLSASLRKLTLTPQQPAAYSATIRSYLLSPNGGQLESIVNSATIDDLVNVVSTLYARMVSGDRILDIMNEITSNKGGFENGWSTDVKGLGDTASCDDMASFLYFSPSIIPDSSTLMKVPCPSTKEALRSAICSEVKSVEVIDVHTHLQPPEFGALCLWGIDELLTYHYLVAEFFMTAPPEITPEHFYALTKQDQADFIWEALFCKRSPISEACRGVLTTLTSLGVPRGIMNERNLRAIREFYETEFSNNASTFCNRVFQKSGVKYVVMTNVPFDAREVKCWKSGRDDSSRTNFRAALRVDPFLAGDASIIEKTLAAEGYELTLDGAKQYLRDWCDRIDPEYVMASTPHDFSLREDSAFPVAATRNKGLNSLTMKQPGAFAQAIKIENFDTGCNGGADEDTPSLIREDSDFLSNVLIPLCEERGFPIALKIGAHRQVNAALKDAGDGLVYADAAILARLCSKYPKVRFLATFLSRNNQHEACVLASKFRNLHVYGCWWFCNNPSLIREITTMRIEMLGTAFTAQHSDARVQEHLLYKWPHSRAVIAEVLAAEFFKMVSSGWSLTRADLRREIQYLFGKSYEEFMMKEL